MRNKFIIFFIVLSLSVANSLAATLVIDSKDWHDVYTGYQYARFKNYDKVLFFSGPLSTDLVTSLIPKNQEVVVIESADNPYFKGYANYLRASGFNKVSEIISKNPYNLNTRLAMEVNAKNFIVVSDSLGYDAISVAPYAYITDSWVLFVNRENIGKVKSLLDSYASGTVLLYGHLGRSIAEKLRSLNPEVINNGDRFSDNIEIAERFEKLKPGNSVLVTTGEFIEDEVMTGGNGKNPVLFTGLNKVYPGFKEFLKKHHIKFVTVVGNDLIPMGTKIRDFTNKTVAVFVKFGQGFTGGVRKTGQVYSLTVFPLPRYNVKLVIVKADYDPKTNTVYTTYKNKGNMPGYLMSNIHIKADDKEVLVISDSKPVLIEPNQEMTIPYKADLSDYVNANLTADFYTMYGDGAKIMDKYVLAEGAVAPPKNMKIGIVHINDKSKVEFVDITYNKALKRFFVRVKNTGEVNAYVDVHLLSVVVDGIKKDLFYGEQKRILPGETKTLMIKADLSPADILDNEEINVLVLYGQEKNILLNKIKTTSELKVVSGNMLTGAFAMKIGNVSVGVLVIALLVAGIFSFIFYKRVKRKAED